jgi:uncharacterized protein
MPTFWQVSGVALVGLVAGRAALILLDAIKRSKHVQLLRQLELEQHQARLEILRDTRRRKASAVEPWNGFRKFVVSRRAPECGDVCSFYLTPHDGRPLPEFKPGQYLTFQLKVPGAPKPVTRCYSLSDGIRPDYYRVSIKRVPAPRDRPEIPPGVGSNFFHDSIKEGDIIDVKAPSGHFCVEPGHERPMVLIGGGIGVTPMLSIVNTVLGRTTTREIWFLYGVRTANELIMAEHLRALTRDNPNLRLHICCSQPDNSDVHGEHYHHRGRVNTEFLKAILPSNNYDFFICGPGPMMEDITTGLREWGVPDTSVFFEAFGPASVKRAAKPTEVAAGTPAAPALEVVFSKTGRTTTWTGKHDSLLEFAEAEGIVMDSGCRAGNCGSCMIAIKSGTVDYHVGHGASVERGTCLACVCKPKEKLVVDA